MSVFDTVTNLFGRRLGLNQNNDLVLADAKGVQRYIAQKSIVASGDTTGITDTTALQNALTAGGVIRVEQSGVLWINKTLVYGSNTTLQLGPGTTIRQVAGTNSTLAISTAHQTFNATGGTMVTITQGTGNAVNVLWAAHGLVVGQGVWLSGNGVSTYNGVFRVDVVVDANNFTVNTAYLATSAPSGTTKAIVAVQNFHLYGGGTFDYNYANNTGSAANYLAHCVNLVGLIDCLIEDCYSGNANKYGYMLNSALNVKLRNLKSINRSDGLKIYGPCRAVDLDGFYGVTQDDLISVQTKEGTGYLPYQPAFGDNYDVKIRNVNGSTNVGGSSVVVYPSDSEVTDRVVIDGVSGSPFTATVNVTCNAPFTTGTINSLILKNVSGIGQTTVQLDKCNISEFRLEQSVPNASALNGSTAAFLATTTNNTCRNITIDGGRSVYPSSGDQALTFLQGVFKHLVIKNFVCDGTGAQQDLLRFSGGSWGAERIDVQDCYFNTGAKYAVQITQAPASTATPIMVAFSNCQFDGLGAFDCEVGTSSGLTFNIVFNSCVFNGLSLGAVRVANANTFNVRGNGGNIWLAGSAVFASVGGTPILTAYGFDLPIDIGGVTGLGKTTSGMYCFNNGSARGTITQNRLVTCNGTNWVQVDVPTNVF